jgi:hypothetical protein
MLWQTLQFSTWPIVRGTCERLTIDSVWGSLVVLSSVIVAPELTVTVPVPDTRAGN